MCPPTSTGLSQSHSITCLFLPPYWLYPLCPGGGERRGERRFQRKSLAALKAKLCSLKPVPTGEAPGNMNDEIEFSNFFFILHLFGFVLFCFVCLFQVSLWQSTDNMDLHYPAVIHLWRPVKTTRNQLNINITVTANRDADKETPKKSHTLTESIKLLYMN